MSDLATEIDAVIRARQDQLPLVRGYIDDIERLDEALKAVDAALSATTDDQSIGNEVRPLLEEFRTVSPLSKIEKMRQAISIVRARFERGTINIGVSGQARVGKSTLLQSLSGLGDEQIPTGRGRPVTAVRSRIEHSATNIAHVEFHSWTTFREEVLRPYFHEIGLGLPPSSIDEFRRLNLTEAASRLDLRQKQRNIHRDLREAQDSLHTYSDLLTGQKREVVLNNINEYVRKTYSESDEAAPARKYLAVRSVRIQCTFPFDEVRRVVLIDLPGLGEISPDAEARHVDGLQNDTDAVVLLKRPTQQTSFWREEDAQALDLVERAKGDIQRTSDFMFILQNQGPDDDPQLVSALSQSLAQDLNDSRPDDPLTILQANATMRDSAANGVLRPILRHLATNLARLDREVFDGARRQCAEQAQSIASLLNNMSEALRSLGREGDDFHEIVDRAHKMRRKLAVDLEDQVRRRLMRAREQVEDNTYIERVEGIYRAIDQHLQTGFHQDRKTWVQDIYESIRTDGQTAPTAGREINRIRVEISRRFNDLDAYFHLRVDTLVDDVARIIRRHTGALLSDRRGRDALGYFQQLAREADHPAEGLASAAAALLELKIEYKTHLHPHVRKELDILQLERDNPDCPGEKILVIAGDISEGGAEKIVNELVQLGCQAAWGIRKALLHQAVVPELILHAAAEQFVDAAIRHGSHESEFQEIARAYRDTIWPGVFQGMKIRSVRISRLKAAMRTAAESASKIAGGN